MYTVDPNISKWHCDLRGNTLAHSRFSCWSKNHILPVLRKFSLPCQPPSSAVPRHEWGILWAGFQLSHQLCGHVGLATSFGRNGPHRYGIGESDQMASDFSHWALELRQWDWQWRSESFGSCGPQLKFLKLVCGGYFSAVVLSCFLTNRWRVWVMCVLASALWGWQSTWVAISCRADAPTYSGLHAQKLRWKIILSRSLFESYHESLLEFYSSMLRFPHSWMIMWQELSVGENHIGDTAATHLAEAFGEVRTDIKLKSLAEEDI